MKSQEAILNENGKSDRRSDRKKRKQTVIYFALASLNGDCESRRIKIGWAENFLRRKQDHERGGLGFRPDFETLCVVSGQKSEESYIDRFFSYCLLDKEKNEEVFSLDVKLIEYIRWLRDQYFVWIPGDVIHEKCVDENTGKNILVKREIAYSPPEIVDASMWLPNEIRKKKKPAGCLPGMFGPLDLPPREMTADDFYTSSKIIDVAKVLFGGHIDLDPASHHVANRIVQARKFFTKNHNGLHQQWAGKVWVNPPFSHWGEWAAKIADEWKSGRVDEMCVLASTRTTTALMFQPVITNAKAICILRGRIAFWGGHATPSPDEGHVIFYFGNKTEKFREVFAQLGSTFQC